MKRLTEEQIIKKYEEWLDCADREYEFLIRKFGRQRLPKKEELFVMKYERRATEVAEYYKLGN